MPDSILLPHQARLLALLEAHSPADSIEAGHHAHVAAFVRSEPACFLRRTLPGHITGSAFVVDAPRRRVLLHHHRKLDRWLQLGGHDGGELDVAATALREAREESGLTRLRFDEPVRVLDVDVHAIPARGEEAAHLHLDVRFLLFAEGDEPLHMDAGESKALSWVDLDEAAARMKEPGGDRALAKIRTRLLDVAPGRTFA